MKLQTRKIQTLNFKCPETDFVARPAMGLVETRLGLGCVAACRRCRCLLHGCVPVGMRPTTLNRAKSVRECPIGFHLVQVPGVPADTLDRATANGRLDDRILLEPRIATNVLVAVDNRLLLPRRDTKALIRYQTLY